jgi:hypothetical protein
MLLVELRIFGKSTFKGKIRCLNLLTVVNRFQPDVKRNDHFRTIYYFYVLRIVATKIPFHEI